MDILAQRKTIGEIRGRCYIDQLPVTADQIKRRSSYVKQEDIFYPTQTVMDAVIFQAQLRLPRSTTYKRLVLIKSVYLHPYDFHYWCTRGLQCLYVLETYRNIRVELLDGVARSCIGICATYKMQNIRKLELASALIEDVGLAGKEHMKVGGCLQNGINIKGLSGGQRRRLSLVRTT